MSDKAKDIIVEFSGWLRISPTAARFQLISDIEAIGLISGREWLALSEEDRENYVLEDVIAAQANCDDSEYTQIDVFEDDTPDT